MPINNVVPDLATFAMILMEPHAQLVLSVQLDVLAGIALARLDCRRPATSAFDHHRQVEVSGSPHFENQRMAAIRAGKSLGSNVCFDTNPTAWPAGGITGAFSIVASSSDSSGVSRPRCAMSRSSENRSGIRFGPLMLRNVLRNPRPL